MLVWHERRQGTGADLIQIYNVPCIFAPRIRDIISVNHGVRGNKARWPVNSGGDTDLIGLRENAG